MGKMMNTGFDYTHMSEDEALEKAAKRSKIYYILFVIIFIIGLGAFFSLMVWNNEEKEVLPSVEQLQSYVDTTEITTIVNIDSEVKVFKQDDLKTYYFYGTVVKSYKGPYVEGDKVEIYKTTSSDFASYQKGDKFIGSFVLNESESLVIPGEAYDYFWTQELERLYQEATNQ